MGAGGGGVAEGVRARHVGGVTPNLTLQTLHPTPYTLNPELYARA